MAKGSNPIITKAGAKRAIKQGKDIRVSKDAVESIIETGDKYVITIGKKAQEIAKYDKRKTVQEKDVKFSTRLVKPEQYIYSQSQVELSREKKVLSKKQLEAIARRKAKRAEKKAQEAKKLEEAAKKKEKQAKKLEKEAVKVKKEAKKAPLELPVDIPSKVSKKKAGAKA